MQHELPRERAPLAGVFEALRKHNQLQRFQQLQRDSGANPPRVLRGTSGGSSADEKPKRGGDGA